MLHGLANLVGEAVELRVDPELEAVEVIVPGRQVAVVLKQYP